MSKKDEKFSNLHKIVKRRFYLVIKKWALSIYDDNVENVEMDKSIFPGPYKSALIAVPWRDATC